MNKHLGEVWVLVSMMFIGLKLTGDIDWSWWLVLLPLLGAYLLAITIPMIVYMRSRK